MKKKYCANWNRCSIFKCIIIVKYFDPNLLSNRNVRICEKLTQLYLYTKVINFNGMLTLSENSLIKNILNIN